MQPVNVVYAITKYLHQRASLVEKSTTKLYVVLGLLPIVYLGTLWLASAFGWRASLFAAILLPLFSWAHVELLGEGVGALKQTYRLVRS